MATPSEAPVSEAKKTSDETESLERNASENANDKLAEKSNLHEYTKDDDSSGSEYESAEEDQNIVDDEDEEVEEILTEEVKKVRRVLIVYIRFSSWKI